MSIPGKVIGISTATMTALPVNLTGLSTDASGMALSATEFGRHLFFTKLGEQGFDGLNRCLLQLLLNRLDDRFALLPFQFPGQKVYTHRAESSLLVHVLVFTTLPPRNASAFFFLLFS